MCQTQLLWFWHKKSFLTIIVGQYVQLLVEATPGTGEQCHVITEGRMLIILFSVTGPASKPFEICVKLFRFVHDLQARVQPYLNLFKMIKKMFYSNCYLSVLRRVQIILSPKTG